jgi:sugar/nucleoside kinase (ribokinase family)
MPTVVSCGIHILDILGRPVERIPPGQNVELLDEIRLTVAGTAAGTSIDLAKLGAKVIAMGAIGDDEKGDFIEMIMKQFGVDTRCLTRKKTAQTSCTMLPIRPNGERPALHVIGANGEFHIDDVDYDAIKSADYLHMGGASLMPKFDGQPMADVLRFAQENNTITTFDQVALNCPNLLEIIEPSLPYVDFFMPGYEEAIMMCGLTDRKDVIQFFLDKGVKHTVFKMGGEGSSLASNEIDEIRVPCFKAKIVDSTGCGDSYCAGFIVGHSMGWDLEKCMKLGTACGALVITGLGSDAGIVDLESTIKLMETAETLPMSE